MTPRAVPVSTAWTVALAATAGVVALAALPPFVGEAGPAVHRAFALVCHQLPERTAHVGGGPLALCHRCLGVMAGLALGVALAPLAPAGLRRWTDRVGAGRLLALALVPTAADWAVGALGVWANTPLSRTLTGALAGAGAGWVLALALSPSRVATSPSHPNLLA